VVERVAALLRELRAPEDAGLDLRRRGALPRGDGGDVDRVLEDQRDAAGLVADRRVGRAPVAILVDAPDGDPVVDVRQHVALARREHALERVDAPISSSRVRAVTSR